MIFFFLMGILVIISLILAALWRVFEKTGRPGWAAIVPIYNAFILLEIVGKPLWWIVLFFIPVINLVAFLLVCIDLAKRFGKSLAFGFGLTFLSFVFFPILGFGEAQYQGDVPYIHPDILDSGI